MSRIIRLNENDLTRIVKRVIKENEDIDRLLRNIVRGFRTEEPKDSTALISDIDELIYKSEDVNDFKMKIKKYTKNNQEDFNKLSDDKRDEIDGFINSVITRHDFN